MKNFFWLFGNYYGKVFGWKLLAPVHHALINLSCHALGYGNALSSSCSGEKNFVSTIVSKYNPKVIVDVGANVGAYSTLLLEATSATVVAIEPNPHCFEKLQSLPNRVITVNAAVSDVEGSATLSMRSVYDEKASLDKSFGQGEQVSVIVRRLDNLLKEKGFSNVDFVKIDTEGHEREVLLSLGSLRPTIIQFEFNIHHLDRGHTLFSLTEILKGYDFYRLIPHGMLPINPKKFVNNMFMFANIVAIRKQ